MNSDINYENEFLKFLACMKESGCLDYVILIGSWAEYMYQHAKILPEYEANFRTKDIDFLIINLKKPKERLDLVGTAKKYGFIYEEDRITGCSKFYGAEQFEIEFLISQRGDGSSKLPKSNIGVNAQQLTHVDMLSGNTIRAAVDQFIVLVPTPEAYVLHKMIINNQRKLKAEKDRLKIQGLLPFLDEQKLCKIYQQQLTKKEQTMVNTYCRNYQLELLLRR